jgi:von Willebrand factor type A domain
MRCMSLSWSRNNRLAVARVAALGLALAFGVGVHAGPAAAESNAVVVLDHSSSMWAQLGGTAKVVAARDLLKTLVEEHEGKLNLGLMLFGSKKANACDDIETLKPIGAIDTKSYSQALDAAKPKGTAPVAVSLAAAGALFKTSGPRSIIMIVDGPDNCKADPCAAARTLKQKSPETIVHLIAFDAQAEERMKDMSCIAETTGGMFATAINEDELELHLRRAFQFALAGTPATAAGPRLAGVAPGMVPPPNAGEGPPVFTSSEPGTIALSAVIADGGQPLTSGVTWRVFDARVQDDGSYRLVSTRREPRPSVTMPPGEYLINVAYGRANVTKRLTIWPGKAQQDVFNLNAGGLRLYATLARQPLVSEHTLAFDVFSEETDQFGNRRKVISAAKPGMVIRLNGGNYRVHSVYGDSNAVIEADVTIEPGKLTEATIDHQAGKVTFRLVLKPGGEAMANTIWNIFSGDGQLVKRSGGAFPSHVLAAGSYQLKVEHDGKEIAASFSVEPGDKKQVEVVIP